MKSSNSTPPKRFVLLCCYSPKLATQFTTKHTKDILKEIEHALHHSNAKHSMDWPGLSSKDTEETKSYHP
eukprot:c14143_g1_i1 orf=16-225(-)